MKKYCNSIYELIGNTPILKIQSWNLPDGVEIFAKLEYLNPGGSNKDRIGLSLIEEAEKKGKLKSGSTIIEPTSGNTGIALALAAIKKGYKVIIVTTEKCSSEKKALMKAFGAQVITIPDVQGTDGAVVKANELAKTIKNSFVPNQFDNQANPLAHYKTTGPEIYEQLGGNIDYFIAGVGTGGTLTGVGRFLKEKNSSIQIIAVEPEGSILGGGEKKAYLVEGIGMTTIPNSLDTTLINSVYTIKDKDSFRVTQQLALREGLLVGASSGTVMVAALKLVQNISSPTRIVIVFPDRSDRYLSKDIYNLSC